MGILRRKHSKLRKIRQCQGKILPELMFSL
jgi:hypothetical protein